MGRVVVAVTAYNDAYATAKTVSDFRRQPDVVKVLVIDNNSTDNTAELAEAAGATVIRELRQGYGYACIRGLAESVNVLDADVVVLTEGDGTFAADDLPKFLAYIDHADLVVGNRVVRGLVARDSQMDSFFTWGNMAVAMLLRLRFWDSRFLGPGGLSDVGCTFRAIRRHSLQSILPELAVGGNHFSPHMLMVALSHGLSVIEIPIRFRRRVGESKGGSRSVTSGLQVGLLMIWDILTFTPKTPIARPVVVVERDGVILRHLPDGPATSRIEFVPEVTAVLAKLSRGGHRVVVARDRANNARLGITPRAARALDARIAAEVEHWGGRVDAFIGCAHTDDPNCSCRYPLPDVLLKKLRGPAIDPLKALVISDQRLFINAAAGLGCRTILVSVETQTPLSDLLLMHAPDLIQGMGVDRDGEPGSQPVAAQQLQTV